MPMQLDWKQNRHLAAMHLAYCATNFRQQTHFRLSETENKLIPLGGAIQTLLVPKHRIWEYLFQLSPDSTGNEDLANRLAIRCLRSEERTADLISRLKSGLREAEMAFSLEYPDFAETIELRRRPLQEQWEAYGPGLLFQVSELLSKSLLVESAEVFLVPPISGGFGWAHLSTNRCHIEAVLTNADHELTEVLRLAWLLGQLDFERPEFSDRINAFQLRRIAGLAMLPTILVAAEKLGLATMNSETLHRGLLVWRIEADSDRARGLAEVLISWWETFCDSQTDWAVALTGLDRMVANESN